MFSVNLSQDIEGTSREIVLDLLRKEIDDMKSNLSSVEQICGDDGDDLDDHLKYSCVLSA
jgi:hypothetical protein